MRFFKLLAVLILVYGIFSTQAEAADNRWVIIGSEKTNYKMYVDADNFYLNEDETITVWTKYEPLSIQTKDFYYNSIYKFMKSNKEDIKKLTKDSYCIYQMTFNIKTNTYTFGIHYWYDKNGNFITKYQNNDPPQPFSEEFIHIANTISKSIKTGTDFEKLYP